MVGLRCVQFWELVDPAELFLHVADAGVVSWGLIGGELGSVQKRGIAWIGVSFLRLDWGVGSYGFERHALST